MENWCYHKPTLMSFAKHYITKESLPDELFNKILKQRTFMTGGAMCRQLYFAMLDLYLYSKLTLKKPGRLLFFRVNGGPCSKSCLTLDGVAALSLSCKITNE